MPPSPALRQPPRLPRHEGRAGVPAVPRLPVPESGRAAAPPARTTAEGAVLLPPRLPEAGQPGVGSVRRAIGTATPAPTRSQTEMIAALMAHPAAARSVAEQPLLPPPSVAAAPRPAPPRVAPPRRPGTAPRWSSLVSVLVHAAVLLLLMFWTHRDLPSGAPQEGIPVVFESGQQGDSTGEPGTPAESAPASGPTPLSPPTPEATPAEAAPQPPVPPPPVTPPVQPPPPEVVPPAPSPVPQPPAPPVPVPPAPPPVPEAVVEPPPPVLEAPTPFALPLRPVPPPDARRAETPPPTPTPREAPARPQRAPNNPFSGMLSLNQAPSIAPGGGNPSSSAPRRPGQGLDMSLSPGLTQRSSPNRAGGGGRDYAAAGQQLRLRSGANPGGDWFSSFKQWVEERKFYPQAAAMRGEDGPVTVQMVIARDGTVQSLRLVNSSGSQSLDAALQSMFRGRKVPAFPPGTEGETPPST